MSGYSNRTGDPLQARSNPFGGLVESVAMGYVAAMATKSRPQRPTRPSRIRKGSTPHLYVREHMEAKGLDAVQMAGRLEMHEKSVYRALNEQSRIWENIEAWADALALDHWQDLTRPPGQPSVDARLEEIPAELRQVILKMVAQ